MRLRNIPRAEGVLQAHPIVVKNAKLYKGKWNQIFGNMNPVHIEIGMGKGSFLLTMAEKNPEINYIGIERYTSVLIKAIKKMEAGPLSNLYFMCVDAANLEQFFAPGDVMRIYLNFSDPWPKDRHARRRLTSVEYLKRYDTILASSGQLEFKTDNESLFDFSLESIKDAGWKLLACTRNLHQDPKMNLGNIMTEYEEKFSAQGNPIYKLIAAR